MNVGSRDLWFSETYDNSYRDFLIFWSYTMIFQKEKALSIIQN